MIVVALLATACGSARTVVSPAPTGLPRESVAGTEPPSVGRPSSRPVGSSGQAIAFKRLTLEDGLSQSTINCIVQDAQGFMWFGTQDGLNRYDGYEFKVYRHDGGDPRSENPHSLSNNYILGCERDRRGVVWVVTRDGTLHRVEPETGRFIRYTLALEDPFQQMGAGAGEFTTLHGDAQGRLWIGTFGDGLVRYDPKEDSFTTYRHDPSDPTSLSHRVVYQVYEDRDGVLWVGTEGGLNRYDPESDSFVRYPYRDFPPGGYQYDPPVHGYDPAFQPDNPHALASPAVTYLLEDREGRLWVGTRYGGLNQLDRESGRFTSYPYDPAYAPQDPNTFSGNSVRELLEDRLGHIWVSSADWNVDETRTYARLGLERLDPGTGTITRYEADPDDPCSLPHQAVFRMFEDSRGTLLFHTFGGGLEVYDQSTGCFVHHGHDPDDAQSLSADDITHFYEDEAGGLWIGTEMGGINHYDPTWAKFPSYRVSATGGERLSNNSIWRIAPSPDGLDADGHAHVLWVSTFAGVNHWERRTNSFTFYEIDPRLPDTLAYAIFEDVERQTLWLGTTMGLERAELPADSSAAPETLDFTRVLTRSSASMGLVLDLHPAGGDQLWLAQYQVGLSRFDLAAEEIVATYRHDPDDEHSLGDDRVTGIFPGQDGALFDGTLWLVTRSGIDHFDPATETFTHYLHDPDNPQSVAERVFTLYQDKASIVWLGTDGEGLQRFDPATGQVTITYQEEHGLPNNVVYSILPDEAGQLWLSTNKGLARFDPEAETFQSYASQDGLQSNEFNLGAQFRAPDGELFFGGVNGINAFYPQEIAPNPYVPPIVITGILLGPPRPPRGAGTPGGASPGEGSETVLEAAPNFTQQIELSYRDRILSFEFAALHYAIPERNQYAYLMEGFDRDWNYVGNRRFATYTNLPPGRYTFRVKGSNGDGVWNERGASLAVTIMPPLWATWWFRGIVGLLLVGGAVAGYRLRVRGIEARNRELERQVAERTEELAAVNAIAATLSRSLDLDDVLADALDKTLEVMSIEAGGIYLLDEETGVLTIAAQRGFSPTSVAEIDRLKMGEGFSGHVAQAGEALVVRDVSEDPRLTRIAVQEEGLRSLAVVPLWAKGRVLGTLFGATRGTREFTDREVQLLTSIGHQIGVAVENAGLYEDTRSRLAQLTALQETTTAVTGTLELERLLRLIVEQATNLLQADGGILNLVDWEAQQDEVVAAAGSAAFTIGHRSSLGGSLSGWVALHKQPVVSNELQADSRVDRSALVWHEMEMGRPVENAAAALLTIKGQVMGTLVLLDKQGGHGSFDQSDLDLLQAFANQAATAIENARLFEAEQRRAEQFRVISDMGRHITSILTVNELLEEIVRLVKKTFGYYLVTVGLIEGDEIVFKAGAKTDWPETQFLPPPLKLVLSEAEGVGGKGITAWVAATGESLLAPDVSREPHFLLLPNSSETRSELAVPLRTKSGVIGVLNVESDQLNAFDESDMKMLESLANQAAIAIENAHLYEQARRLAVVEERQRLARELHDSVTQALYGATLYAEATARQLASGQVELATEHLRELRDTAQEALREMRLLIFELRPSALESEGLVTALRARLEAVEERAGLEVGFQVEGEATLPAEIEEGLYRIAQEALNNALKHARARNVSVYLNRGGEAVILEITDDGIGFDPSTAVEGSGLGLDGMIERAAHMGGELVLDSEPGAGTRVRVEVPR